LIFVQQRFASSGASRLESVARNSTATHVPLSDIRFGKISSISTRDSDLVEERSEFVDAGLDGVEVAFEVDGFPRQ